MKESCLITIRLAEVQSRKMGRGQGQGQHPQVQAKPEFKMTEPDARKHTSSLVRPNDNFLFTEQMPCTAKSWGYCRTQDKQ